MAAAKVAVDFEEFDLREGIYWLRPGLSSAVALGLHQVADGQFWRILAPGCRKAPIQCQWLFQRVRNAFPPGDGDELGHGRSEEDETRDAKASQIPFLFWKCPPNISLSQVLLLPRKRAKPTGRLRPTRDLRRPIPCRHPSSSRRSAIRTGATRWRVINLLRTRRLCMRGERSLDVIAHLLWRRLARRRNLAQAQTLS